MSIHKYLLKGGIGYRAVVQLGQGKTTSKKFKRKLDAETWQREQSQLTKEGAGRKFEPSLTIRDLSSRWLESALSDRRERSSNHRYEICVRRQVLPHLGSRKVLELTPMDADSWLRSLKVGQSLSAKTINLCLFILKKMLSDAVRWQLIRYSPLAGVKPLHLPEREFKFWSQNEVVQFLTYLRSDSPDDYPIFGIALYTGMRLGEIQALKWDCVDLDKRQITVKRTFCLRDNVIKETTKSKRIRRIPINGPLLEVLISLRNRKGEVVVPGFEYQHASRRTGILANSAGVKVIRFHDLRHTFASLFVMSGGQIYKLQRLLGHSTIQMTEKYSHLSPEHLADATEMLNFDSPKPADVISIAR